MKLSVGQLRNGQTGKLIKKKIYRKKGRMDIGNICLRSKGAIQMWINCRIYHMRFKSPTKDKVIGR